VPARSRLSEIIRLEPNPTNKCFGCGGDNAGRDETDVRTGQYESQKLRGRFVWASGYQGGGGFAHGGSLRCCSMKPWAKSAAFRGRAR